MLPTGESRAPSERFLVAMQRYAGTAEEKPPVSVIGDSQMRNVMRTPEGIPSQVYYFELRHGTNNGDGRDGDLITGIEIGKAAGEFMKTSDYGLADTNRTIKIKEGQGIVLMQKNAPGLNGSVISDVVEEFETIQVNKGQEVVIPPGFFYALVNPNRENILVVQHSEPRIKDHKSDNPNSEAIRAKHGFAYRVVAADSHVCLQPNKNYREVKKFQNGGIPLFGENLD